MTLKYGIDFGTTNSSIALRIPDISTKKENTVVFDVEDVKPFETLPSVVYIDEDRKVFVGTEAKREFPKNHKIQKNLIKEIKLELENKGVNGEFFAGESAESFRTIELIAAVFRKLKEKADETIKILGIKVDGVVLGVPVQFADNHKKVMQEALIEAGFYKTPEEAEEKTEFVSEPVAVALNYGLQLDNDKTVMVFDFGGGTLDLAIMNLKHQVGRDKLHPHETKSKARLTLGGEKLTKLFFLNGFLKKYEIDELNQKFKVNKNFIAEELWDFLTNDVDGVELISKIDELKCELSLKKIVEFSFSAPGIVLDDKTFFRDDFESSIESVLDDIEDKIEECLNSKEGRIEIHQIDNVLLSGGSSLIPCIQTLLTDKFGRNKIQIKKDSVLEGIFPDIKKRNALVKESEVLTSVVRGLAAVGCKNDVNKLLDIVDSNYGVWNSEGHNISIILEKGTRIVDTKYDKLNISGGCKRDYHAIAENPSSIDIRVFQTDEQGNRELGTICINNPGSGKYKIFFRIEANKGWLVVDIYDRKHMRWYDDIPLDDRVFNI